MVNAKIISHDPGKLAALCSLWKSCERQVWVRLDGRSMVPTIPDGSRIRLDCVQRPAQVGEIVVYRQEGGLVVHRVVAILSDSTSARTCLLCQGDGNAHMDAPVPEDCVVGIITAIHRPSIAQRTLWFVRAIACRPLALVRRVLKRGRLHAEEHRQER